MDKKVIIMDEISINRSITRLSHEILERNKNIEDIVIIGIKTRGMPLANKIQSKINNIENKKLDVYEIDPSNYRDDIKDKRIIDRSKNKDIDIENKTVILVDDVLFTGRTIRATLDALIDNGRPKKVQLLVLIDRGHRELPIRPDYVGKNVPTSIEEKIEVKFEEVDGINQVIIAK